MRKLKLTKPQRDLVEAGVAKGIQEALCDILRDIDEAITEQERRVVDLRNEHDDLLIMHDGLVAAAVCSGARPPTDL